MVVPMKTTISRQSEIASRKIEFCDTKDDNTSKHRQKLRRRASSFRSSSLFSFRGVVSITLALIYFHILLVDGLEPTTSQSARRKNDHPREIKKRKLDGAAFRIVRNELMLEETLYSNDIFAEDQPVPSTKSESSEIPLQTAEIPEKSRSVIVIGNVVGTASDDDGFGASDDDGLISIGGSDDDGSISIQNVTSNVTSDDDFFVPTPEQNITQKPSEVPTMSPEVTPSEVPTMSPEDTTFMPIEELETDDDDPLGPLIFTPSSAPTDSIDGRQDGPTPSPTIILSTSEPTADDLIVIGGPFPTFQPFPTNFPTRQPSFRPTFPPTEPPTPGPTFPPTPLPTPPPTPFPTFPPTPLPTPPPTPFPTFTPTPLPTPPPTAPPTPFPTPPPTALPTPLPTPLPTLRPTFFPTHTPTPLPTARPTDQPTFRPTFEPTITRSSDPTPSGSFEPTISPEPSVPPSKSPQPTNYPTGSPSASPTIAPTLPKRRSVVSGEMKLQPLQETLSRTEYVSWERVTENFVEKYLRSKKVESTIRADFRSQYVDMIQDTTGTTRRFLQGSNSETPVGFLMIQFILDVEYRSPNAFDVNQLVWSAFDSPEEQAEYVLDLQDEASIFDPIREINVDVQGFVPSPTQAPEPEPGSNMDIAVIAGASVGGVAFVILMTLLFLRGRSGKSEEEKGGTESQITPSTTKNIKVSTEILVEPQDDVSTLGDPMFGQGGMMMGGIERDEMTAT